MPTELLALSPLAPFLAVVFIACGMATGRILNEQGERTTRRMALCATQISLALIFAAMACKAFTPWQDHIHLGTWLESGTYRININFILDWLGLTMAALVAGLSTLTLRFSAAYMHRESGFHRFFLIVSLFAGSMLLLATAGNAGLAFVGWELAGLSSYLLIAYNFERPTATANATRVFVTNRVGDAGFLLGIALTFFWTGSIDWAKLTGQAHLLQEWQANVLACCFLLAALAKSAQLPFTPWLSRAMEGPTPSSALFYSAVMVHAGVYLVLRLQPLFEQAPLAMASMAGLGVLTASYGYYCGLAQTDVKSALIQATSGQVGLMFFAAGLGYWRLALVHLCAHALLRSYQFFTAPALMHHIAGVPPRPLPRWLAHRPDLYLAALQRLWLEAATDWVLVKPVQRLAADMESFDQQIIQPAFGLPNPAPAKTVGKDRENPEPACLPEIPHAEGWAGLTVGALSNVSNWLEAKLLWQGASPSWALRSRNLGRHLNQLETLFTHPRYLVVLILATLLAVF